MFKHLKQYKADHGDCAIPYIYHANKKLGHWVIRQHRDGREGKITTLCRDMLNSIDFDWDPMKTKWDDTQWKTMFHRLEGFKAEHGYPELTRKIRSW